MKKTVLILIFIITFFASNKLSAQWAIMREDADSLVQLGSKYIYNIEFDKAEAQFNEVIKRYPEHPVGYFLNSMVYYWKLTIYRTSTIFDDTFLKKNELVINQCEDILDKSPNDIVALFFKGAALGYRARYYTQKKEYIKAATDGKEAFDILMSCHEQAPGNHDIMLGSGIYNYFVAVLPEQYPMLKPITAFFPPGNKKIGILQLKACSYKGKYANTEAKVALFQIYYMFEKDNHEALASISELYNLYPNNPYFHRYLGRLYVNHGLWDSIEVTWREIVKRSLSRREGYDNMTAREGCYYIGQSLYRKNDVDGALKYYLKCEEISAYLKDDENGFRAGSMLMIAQLYKDKNRKDLARQYYQKVLKLADVQNSHSKAQNGLKYLK